MRRLDHVVLDVRSEAVLWPENRRQPHVVGRRQPIDDVQEAAVERGVVADDADAKAMKAAGRQEYI
jgi:hypothetical protein